MTRRVGLITFKPTQTNLSRHWVSQSPGFHIPSKRLQITKSWQKQCGIVWIVICIPFIFCYSFTCVLFDKSCIDRLSCIDGGMSPDVTSLTLVSLYYERAAWAWGGLLSSLLKLHVCIRTVRGKALKQKENCRLSGGMWWEGVGRSVQAHVKNAQKWVVQVMEGLASTIFTASVNLHWCCLGVSYIKFSLS